MLLPGKVENWILIIDLSGIGLLNLPKESMGKAITCFSNNYRSRLCKMFVLNTSFVVKAMWMIAQSFMDPATQVKIRLTSDNTHPELLELVHPEQLLKEYGGNAVAPRNSWPAYFPPGKIREEFVTDHLTEEEYKKEVKECSRIVPTPELAQFARENSKATNKRGTLPHKTFYFPTRIERRDSFNGIVTDDQPKVQEKKIESTICAPTPKKVEPEAKIEEKKEEKKEETVKIDKSEEKQTIKEKSAKPDTQNDAPKIETAAIAPPPTKNADNDVSGQNSTKSADTKIQPRLENKQKTNEDNASCSCLVL